MNFRKTLLAATMLLVPGLATAQPVSGLYIAGGAGVNWLQDARLGALGTLTDPVTNAPVALGGGNIAFDPGWAGVVSLGWGFGNGVRAEIEGNFRENSVDKIRTAGQLIRAGGRSRTYGVMANAFYDFDLGLNFGGISFLPYIGVGAGYAWREFDNIGGPVPGFGPQTIRTDGTDGRFAYQAILGAATALTQWVPGLALTAEYRFFGTLENRFDTDVGGGGFAVQRTGPRSENYNHSIMLGLRYAFAAPPPPPVVAPVAPPAPAAAPAPARTFLVFFDFDRADLTDRARQIISDAAQAARAVQTTRIEVAGHADRAGNPQYNQRLSERRAQSVAAELERQGVPRGIMVIQAFGETRPLVPTADGVREPQNRRVEIVLR